jgi:hypothetical protein
MERGKTGEDGGVNQNCKKLIFITKIELENKFQYLPLW